MKNKHLVLFDFDGTLTRKDSFMDFIDFAKGSATTLWGVFVLSPIFLLLLLGVLSAKTTKEIVLQYFFKGMTYRDFQYFAEQYAEHEIPKILKKSALHCLEEHIERKDTIFIVSASPEDWILPWAKHRGIGVIATKLDVQDGKMTGKLASPNCKGIEKVNRIHAEINLNDFESITAYGDSKGDQEMLALADKAFFRLFKQQY